MKNFSINFIQRKKAFIKVFFILLIIFSLFYIFYKNGKEEDVDNMGNIINVAEENIKEELNVDSDFVMGILDKIFSYNEETVDYLSETFRDKQKRVPEEFSTIQEAINIAKKGDVILVSAGEYKENIVMKDGVSIIGENNETTILDGSENGNVVFFENISDSSTRIENFTIKNSGENLGGIFIENSSPLINRNILTDNDYGIYIKGDSSPLLQRNRISLSKAGVQIFNLEYPENSNITIIDNVIYQNKKGVNIYNGKAIIQNNTISFNSYYKDDLSATFGVYLYGSHAEIKNNIITDNGICELCSGIYADEKSSEIEIDYNNIWNNKNNFLCFGECVLGENNISVDPEFEDEETLVLKPKEDDEGDESDEDLEDKNILGPRI